MIFSESNQAISKSLVAAWGSIEAPKHNSNVTVKTKTGSSYEFSYTDLDGIFEAVRAVYKENKIAIIQDAKTEPSESGLYVSVETMLLHESGEWVKSTPLQVTASHSMQDLGGQITYMKRYSLSAMLGIATEKDDDANGVSGNQIEYKNQSSQNPPEREQYKKPQETKKETSTSEDKADKSLISPAQIGFTEKLKKQKKITDDDYNRMISEISEGGTDIKLMTKKQASDFITLLTNYVVVEGDPFEGEGKPLNISDDDLPF